MVRDHEIALAINGHDHVPRRTTDSKDGESTLNGDDPMATYYTIEEGHYSMGNTSTNICSYSQVQHIPGLEHDFVALRVCELWIKVQIRGTPVDGRVARRRVILRVQR